MAGYNRQRTLHYALFTALGLGLGFLVLGKFIFSVLGILSADFLIAGGLILLVLSVKDLVTAKESQRWSYCSKRSPIFDTVWY
jgi:multiple antibiotic resistance protein